MNLKQSLEKLENGSYTNNIKKTNYRFFFHFNKPMSQKTGEVIWSLHFRNQCYILRDILCTVPVETKRNKRQPKGVVQGFCQDVIVVDNVAKII